MSSKLPYPAKGILKNKLPFSAKVKNTARRKSEEKKAAPKDTQKRFVELIRDRPSSRFLPRQSGLRLTPLRSSNRLTSVFSVIASESELLSIQNPVVMMREFLAGMKHSIEIMNPLLFLLSSSQIRSASMKMTCLNLVLYIGTDQLMRLIYWCFSSNPKFSEEDYLRLKGHWIFLVHLVSYQLSSFWFAHIAEQTWKVYGKEVANTTNASLKTMIRKRSQQIYRFFLFGLVLLQIQCLSWFPVIGNYLKFLAWCLISGYYSFDCKWRLSNKSLMKRLSMLEEAVCYFMGFGFLLTFIGVFIPQILGYGILPTLFISNVIVAVVKEPVHLTNSRVPVFYPTTIVIAVTLMCWKALCKKRNGKKTS